jgi:7-carboxy-7-deazaguanine synthase (Cx14CxxC type)
MRIYSVKEIFYTLQGEGARSGRAAVFLRFAGCNLWTGREQDRAGAVCRFCDTDFVGVDGPGGGKFESADALADAVAARWPSGLASAAGAKPYAVCTGGEPLLQLDAPLIDALHARGFEVAVETNGTIAALPGIDWICVSPKGRAPLVQLKGDELKFVYPQEDAEPAGFEALPFSHFFIQPMDGPRLHENVAASAAFCLAHPLWRLSLQMHKLAGIP